MKSLIPTKFDLKFFVNLTALLILVSAILGGCSYLNRKSGLEDENPIEELIESAIEAKTGLDIDLTPETKEVDYINIL